MSGHLFESRHYNALAEIMSDIMLDTKPDLIPVVTSAFLRVAHAMALKSSNMQIGRFMSAAGIPTSTNPKDTRRD